MTTLAHGLSKPQRARFEDRGLVKLEGFIPRPVAGASTLALAFATSARNKT